ncbi:MAG: hypothetical protein JWM95_1913 [Gemmatimonadetes bacterium]|nr:hypothetical protein [Gemmatimonadota bacterium]
MLLAPGLAAQRGVSGVVREDSTKRPLIGITVVIEALNRQTTTDAQGRYTLADLPVGSHMVLARQPGWVPSAAVADVKDGAMQARDFSMSRAPVNLDTLVIKDQRSFGVGLAGFEDRRRKGFGKFIDSTELRSRDYRAMGDLLRSISGVSLANPPYCGQPFARGTQRLVRRYNCIDNRSYLVAMGGPMCAMQVMLDGVSFIPGKKIDNEEPPSDPPNDWTSTIDIASVPLRDVTAIEVYRRNGEVPMEYRSNSTECGLILLWTRRGAR